MEDEKTKHTTEKDKGEKREKKSRYSLHLPGKRGQDLKGLSPPKTTWTHTQDENKTLKGRICVCDVNARRALEQLIGRERAQNSLQEVELAVKADLSGSGAAADANGGDDSGPIGDDQIDELPKD